MKIEVNDLFLFILANFMNRGKIDFRSNDILLNAFALNIATVNENIHVVKTLCKKDAHVAFEQSALNLARNVLKNFEESDFLTKKNLKRCVYVIENWRRDAKKTKRVTNE